MSFGPKPVNYTLNRDMLGKILSHTREDMATEVQKMTFETFCGTLTLEQARIFLLTQDVTGCNEPGCDLIVGEGDNICRICRRYVCLKHIFHNTADHIYYCHNCKVDVCPTCNVAIHYDNQRCTSHGHLYNN